MSLGRMLYGAGLSAILAVLLVAFAARDRRPRVCSVPASPQR